MGYFSTVIIKDLFLLDCVQGTFRSLTVAYLYIFCDFTKLMFILMAFGTQLYEWQLFSTMIAFQANVPDSELLVQRFAYQELERSIEKWCRVFAIISIAAMFLVEIYSVQFPYCADGVIFTCT